MHRLVPLGLSALLVAGCGASGGGRSKDPSRPQVVVLDIEGAGPVQSRIEELTQRRFEVIDAGTYWETAKRLKADKLTRRNIAKVAGELNAVAVVHGKATGKKRRQVVTIYVRDADSGKLLERYRLTVRNGVVAKKGKRRLERKLLARVKTPAASEPDDDEEAADEETAAEPAGDKTAAKKPDQADEEEEEPPLPPVKYDDSGQAVDDELPPM